MTAREPYQPTGRARYRARLAAIMGGLAILALAATAEARRIALVIGNDSYQAVTPLKNARSDAKAIAAALKNLGFEVVEKEDLNDHQFKSVLREFKARVEGGDEVIFYFAGHGVQFGGMNYLVPVDIVADSEGAVVDGAVPLSRVLDDLHEQKARFALAIVDACRDNPFKNSGRALGGRGLAPVQPARGQIVVYSAAAGEAALDRLGTNDPDPNGVFTRVLISQMNRPGVPADQLMRDVKLRVAKLAEGAGQEQVPEIYDGALGSFYLRAGTETVNAPVEPIMGAPPPAAAASAGVHVPTASERDELFWERVKDSNDPQDFKAYTQEFPKGLHAPEAALMLRRLSRPADPPPAAAPAVATPAVATTEQSGSNWSASSSANLGAGIGAAGYGGSSPQMQKLVSMARYETQDFGVPATRQVHSGVMHGSTPSSIPGGRVITTADLVALIQANRTPYLLFDVLGNSMTLPGALPAAWASAPGTLGDSVERQMGVDLYRVTHGNRNVALIFFCLSNHCWMSYNAALRAIDLGYSNVFWYRGGLEAWNQAGLPTIAARGY